MAYYEDYMKSKTIDSRVNDMYGENPIHSVVNEMKEMLGKVSKRYE